MQVGSGKTDGHRAKLLDEGLQNRREALLVAAAKKRQLAEKLRDASGKLRFSIQHRNGPCLSERAFEAQNEIAKSISKDAEHVYQQIEQKYQNCANRRRATVLDFEAGRLEG
eukprot:Lankesteria_metandrocarpae@DN7765_c0_g1_i1.p1